MGEGEGRGGEDKSGEGVLRFRQIALLLVLLLAAVALITWHKHSQHMPQRLMINNLALLLLLLLLLLCIRCRVATDVELTAPSVT
jgi:hypothetical protein